MAFMLVQVVHILEEPFIVEILHFYLQKMKFNKKIQMVNRDRFILSKGHAACLLCCILKLYF